MLVEGSEICAFDLASGPLANSMPIESMVGRLDRGRTRPRVFTAVLMVVAIVAVVDKAAAVVVVAEVVAVVVAVAVAEVV